MARYFAQNFELLILDEPTIHLDQQRRQALTDLLLKLKVKIPQMIIVTHDPELEIVGDRVVRVKNVNGVSKVTVS
jgi:exonuclease SbcC